MLEDWEIRQAGYEIADWAIIDERDGGVVDRFITHEEAMRAVSNYPSGYEVVFHPCPLDRDMDLFS